MLLMLKKRLYCSAEHLCTVGTASLKQVYVLPPANSIIPLTFVKFIVTNVLLGVRLTVYF